jgi:hypothetical protein
MQRQSDLARGLINTECIYLYQLTLGYRSIHVGLLTQQISSCPRLFSAWDFVFVNNLLSDDVEARRDLAQQ